MLVAEEEAFEGFQNLRVSLGGTFNKDYNTSYWGSLRDTPVDGNRQLEIGMLPCHRTANRLILIVAAAFVAPLALSQE